MVVMPLTLNHVQIMAESIPGLARYAELGNQTESAVIVTHIFPNSQLYRSRTITVGSTIKEINGKAIQTLADVRDAIKAGKDSKFLTIKASDNVSRASDNVFVALPLEKVLDEEPALSKDYHYAMSSTVKELLDARPSNKQIDLGNLGVRA